MSHRRLVLILLLIAFVLPPVQADTSRTETHSYVASGGLAAACVPHTLDPGGVCFAVERGETQVDVTIDDLVFSRTMASMVFVDDAGVVQQTTFCSHGVFAIPPGSTGGYVFLWGGPFSLTAAAFGTSPCGLDPGLATAGNVILTFS